MENNKELSLKGTRSVRDLVARSDVASLLQSLSDNRAEYTGLICIAVRPDALIDISVTNSLDDLTVLGALMLGIQRFSNYEDNAV